MTPRERNREKGNTNVSRLAGKEDRLLQDVYQILDTGLPHLILVFRDSHFARCRWYISS